eukprot:TRINITY_DN13030_c0_g1_i1.p1 TRINITY_DN13030_c0_g1~~TRINITY_DN13030_c0_g1_i1.p1  ORF type:complete len:269 (+),score=37.96 TRINITY_DN13030_c0_g1_i1:1-807(+)
MLSLGPEQLMGNFLLGSMASLSVKGSDGKSGSLFFTSHDGRYMVKTIPATEKNTLLRTLPQYYEYMFAQSESSLTKYCGLHEIDNNTFVVMQNVFDTTRTIHEIYDLKGSTVGRSNPNAGVKKDLDFQKMITLPLHLKKRFLTQLNNDSKFLESMSIIDYSLLVGYHNEDEPDANSQPAPIVPHLPLSSRPVPFYATEDGGMRIYDIYGKPTRQIIFVGIIDTLTEYNFFKKAERWGKSWFYPAEGISSAPPEAYGERFRSALEGKLG